VGVLICSTVSIGTLNLEVIMKRVETNDSIFPDDFYPVKSDDDDTQCCC